MTYQRKYDFKSGTRISSGQVDEEFNQLIAAVNALETADTSIKSSAQMMKITKDDGSVKLNITDPTKDLLVELVALGRGRHTFYAVTGTKKLPSSNSFRGEMHQTSPGYGWLDGYDSKGIHYSNYLDNGTWLGWRGGIIQTTPLWTGSALMAASTTVTPTKKLSECQNGWILYWSDFNVGEGPNDFDFVFSASIQKYAGTLNGKSHLVQVPNYLTSTVAQSTEKRLFVYDNKLVGHDDNIAEANNSNDVCLRAILEW